MFHRIYDLSPVKSRLAAPRPRRAEHVRTGRAVRESSEEEVTKWDLRKKFEETAKRRRCRLCNLIGDAVSGAVGEALPLEHNVKAAAGVFYRRITGQMRYSTGGGMQCSKGDEEEQRRTEITRMRGLTKHAVRARTMFMTRSRSRRESD